MVGKKNLGEGMSSIKRGKHFSSNSRVILDTIADSQECTTRCKQIGEIFASARIKRDATPELEIKFFLRVSIRDSTFG